MKPAIKKKVLGDYGYLISKHYTLEIRFFLTFFVIISGMNPWSPSFPLMPPLIKNNFSVNSWKLHNTLFKSFIFLFADH